MADEGKLVVPGISMASPFAQSLIKSADNRFKRDTWENVDCKADIVMESGQWAEEATNGLFNRPYVILRGHLEKLRCEGGFFDGVQEIQFPFDIVLNDEASVSDDILPTEPDVDTFSYDGSMVPTLDLCYRFTFEELAGLAVRGAVMEVPELPAHIVRNDWVDIPISCDITRFVDVENNETFWFVDAPSADFRKQHGFEIESGSQHSGYQLVMEIPESQLMKQFGAYYSIPGMQDDMVVEAYSDELENGDFDLSNALFQDEPTASEDTPIVGHDLEKQQLEPMDIPQQQENASEYDMDVELVDNIVKEAMSGHDEDRDTEASEIIETPVVEEVYEPVSDLDTLDNAFQQFAPEEVSVEDSTDDTALANELFSEPANAEEMLFGETDETEDTLADKKRKNILRQQQAEKLDREDKVTEYREKANRDNINLDAVSDEELSQQLFGD